MSQSPEYLYKILALRHWQATQSQSVVQISAEDHSFIHLATAEQLDRIIAKYWAEAPQFVVLKVRTNQLKGRLAFETNPGGSSKYYHLYEGLIPVQAIAEAKIVYQTPQDELAKLPIVELGNPVLREPARELTVEEIRGPEIQSLIELMKATMRAAPGVGLAAPQIGRPLQLVVIEDMDHRHLTAEQLAERNRFPVPFHVVINPRLYIEEFANECSFFEGCLSVPELLGVVPRAAAVRVECLNEQGLPVEIHAKGWYARILQHEIDHLRGTLFIDRAVHHTLMTGENYAQFHKHKSVDEVLSTQPQ